MKSPSKIMIGTRWFAIILVAVFFLIAGTGKLVDPLAFARSIGHYQLISFPYTWPFALWLPWVEVLSALGLFWGWARRDAALILLGLLVVFEAALLSAWLRGLNIDCGCLGSFDNTQVEGAFIRNLFLIFLVLYILYTEFRMTKR